MPVAAPGCLRQSVRASHMGIMSAEPNPKPQAEPNPAETTPQDPAAASKRPREIGGPKGPEPTRYGDWEVGGRCIDF